CVRHPYFPSPLISGRFPHAGLIEALPFSQVAERSHVGQIEYKPIFILVSDTGKKPTAIFHANATAVPIVARLDRSVLQQCGVGIVTCSPRCAESPLEGRAISCPKSQRVELNGDRNVVG